MTCVLVSNIITVEIPVAIFIFSSIVWFVLFAIEIYSLVFSWVNGKWDGYYAIYISKDTLIKVFVNLLIAWPPTKDGIKKKKKKNSKFTCYTRLRYQWSVVLVTQWPVNVTLFIPMIGTKQRLFQLGLDGEMPWSENFEHSSFIELLLLLW